MSGTTSESVAECHAMQHDTAMAETLGAPPAAAHSLAVVYFHTVYPDMPDGYTSGEDKARLDGLASIGDLGRFAQYEAAQAIGMSRLLSLRRIIFPQAMRMVIPPLGNEFIGMVKLTALASVIAPLPVEASVVATPNVTGSL